MEFKLETGRLSAIDADILVVGLFEGENAQRAIPRLDKSFPPSFLRQIAPVCSRERFQGKAGKSVTLHTYGSLACKKLILWGLGKVSDYSTAT
ncbi:MAG TPA: M17 family peptidase N-terminal domain-containing protein, partial [Candidatus Obscuribacterales bacterium]